MYLYAIIIYANTEERRIGTRTWIMNAFEELEVVQAQRLAVAGVIVEELRSDIFDKTGYRCSAGISQNKVEKIKQRDEEKILGKVILSESIF